MEQKTVQAFLQEKGWSKKDTGTYDFNGLCFILAEYKDWIIDSPAQPPVNGEELAEELWDKYSYHVDDDIDSLQMVAGSSILRETSYKKLITELLAATPPASPAKAEQPFNRDENSVEGKAAIEFYEWLKRTSVLKTDIPINIKWRMFVDQKNVKQTNNQ